MFVIRIVLWDVTSNIAPNRKEEDQFDDDDEEEKNKEVQPKTNP